MNAVEVEGVSKVFPARPDHRVLDDVTFTAAPGTTTAIVGRNGAGKSTLLRLIAGISSPTTGTIRRAARCASLIELGAGMHPELTGRENIDLGLALAGLGPSARRTARAEAMELAGLGDRLDLELRHFSSGMLGRLACGVAIASRPDLLLVDEVLAVGDAAFQRTMLANTRARCAEGTAMLLVTHSLELAAAATDRTIWIDGSRIRADGPTDAVLHEYEATIRNWSRETAPPDLRIERLSLGAETIAPHDPLRLSAVVRTMHDRGPVSLVIEARAAIGDDATWMRSADEAPQVRHANLVAASAPVPLGRLRPGVHHVDIDLDQVPISPTLLELSVILQDADHRSIDEVTASLEVGGSPRRPHFALRGRLEVIPRSGDRDVPDNPLDDPGHGEAIGER